MRNVGKGIPIITPIQSMTHAEYVPALLTDTACSLKTHMGAAQGMGRVSNSMEGREGPERGRRGAEAHVTRTFKPNQARAHTCQVWSGQGWGRDGCVHAKLMVCMFMVMVMFMFMFMIGEIECRIHQSINQSISRK